jgi:hypothetical protein
MFNSSLFKNILLMVGGAILSIWMGMSLVTDQTETILQIVAASFLIVCLSLGMRIWLLLVFMSSMDVVLYQGFGTKELGQAGFIGICVLLFLMRKLKTQFKFGELEIWILLIIMCCLQTYMRNPVGLNIFGGGSVGGKPYIMVILSIAAAAVLSAIRVEPKEIKWAMWLSIMGGFAGIPGNILRTGEVVQGDGERIPLLSKLGAHLSKILVSFISPIRACFHPLWGFVLLVSIAAAAGSGYRNTIAGIGGILILGIAYRSGFLGLVLSLLGGAMGLGILALVNLNFPLPANIQRALSPFPGTWEERYVRDADDSTEWRVEMWKEALTSEKWIHNKILGDGVGMTAQQLQSNMNIRAVGKTAGGLLVQQESMLINGSYHSGPIHTIRAVGYVGLTIIVAAMVRVAVHAHRQIIRCRGTEWFPIALYFCLNSVFSPIYFVFIFGEFQTGVASVVMGIALIRLLEKNLPLPAYNPRRVHAHIPLAVRARSPQTP